METAKLQALIHEFNEKRGWLPYNNHRDLVLAMAEEVGELAKLVAWKQEIPESALSDIRLELADIFMYLASFANLYQLDLEEAVLTKLNINEGRFPDQSAAASD